MALPAEAHQGLSRVWLEILSERHPGVAWVLSPESTQRPQEMQPLTTEDELAVVA
jgi:hypothetical protein